MTYTLRPSLLVHIYGKMQAVTGTEFREVKVLTPLVVTKKFNTYLILVAFQCLFLI